MDLAEQVIEQDAQINRIEFVHPFVADFYRRADAYRALGFDESRFIDQMRTDTRLSEAGYIADSAAYADLLARPETS